ncbi:hypothetical protein EDD68_102161 [Melghiribacillus thermohalophilus]|uniref:O-antigen ligase n=1 Tax=Melghiribacillus thermohalophilus TaxID=1324956 RepID=A0A4R3NAZ6_9BACI|nr:O-antigen ligase family protein [Melghiribacillus thermohalophilus]TCT26459.1 hypothetical protein EDD68_102161 [Melghiribacillus thermohalophilus]
MSIALQNQQKSIFNFISVSWIIFIIGSYVGYVYTNVYNPVVLFTFAVFAFCGLRLFFTNVTYDYFILFFTGYHIISGIAYNNLYDFLSLTIYSILLLFMYLIVEYLKYNAITYVSYIIMIINNINFLIIMFSPVSKTRVKYIFNLAIEINSVEFLRFSVTALVALISFIFALHLKPQQIFLKIFKFSTLATSLYIIFFSGKLSILGSFIIVLISSFIIFKVIKNKILQKIITVLIIAITFSSSFFMEFIISKSSEYGLNYRLIFSGREEIWIDYINYYKNLSVVNQLIGVSYVRNINNIGGFLQVHPHNQYLTILIGTGAIGFFLYTFLFYKAYKATLISNDRRGFMLILAINLYGLTDDYVFLTVSCINAFYIIYYFSIHKMIKKVGTTKGG